MVSQTALLDIIIKGNAAEAELLQKMKEGSDEIFEGSISESQKRNAQLEVLKQQAKVQEKSMLDENGRLMIRDLLRSIMALCERGEEEHNSYYLDIASKEHDQTEAKIQENKRYGGFRRVRELDQLCRSLQETMRWDDSRLDLASKMRAEQDRENDTRDKSTNEDLKTQYDHALVKMYNFKQDEISRLLDIRNAAAQIAALEGLSLYN